MLGVGWTEMLVIGVVALIVIGPKDLPMVMRRVGQFAGTVRRMGNEFQRELNRTTGLDEVRNLRSSLTAPLKQTTDEIRREFNSMTSTGVQPSGALKPADPAAQSVVDEIHAAAGIKPATTEGAAPAAAPLEIAPTIPTAPDVLLAQKLPVKAKRPSKATPLPASTVVVSELTTVGEVVEKPKVAVKKGSGKKSAEVTVPSEPGSSEMGATTLAPAPRRRTAKPKAEKA